MRKNEVERLFRRKELLPAQKIPWKEIRQVFLINLAATATAVAFNGAFWGTRAAFSAENLVSCFIYSNSIGTSIYLSFRGLDQLAPSRDNSGFARLIKVLITIFAATFIGIAIARLILGTIYQSFAKNGLLPSGQNLVFSLCIASIFGFAFYFYEISQAKLRLKELDEEKAKLLAAEAQLASLESRIQPHFLFNTLNSIAALIREDPVLAEVMVEKLSALLRYSLDSAAKSLVPFKTELEITRKYLDIEKVRFDQRLDYEVICEAGVEATPVPPLSLQTLVENSIKHVAAKTSGKTEIKITAKISDDAVIVEISDGGAGFGDEKVKEGHGIDVLQKRLSIIFHNRAELELTGTGTVRMKIPT